MRRVCGVRTVKGAVTFCGVMSVFYILIKIYKHSTRARNRGINHEDVIRLGLCAFVFILGMFFLKYTFLMLRRYLISHFPVACGHRKCIFSGRSSIPLPTILSSVDIAMDMPTQEQLQEFKEKALLYLNDIKSSLEDEFITKFQLIFSGSAVEGYGIPVMMKEPSSCSTLKTDLDVMFCSMEERATFSDQGNILIEPLVTKTEGFTGYAQLKYLTPGVQRCVSSNIIREKVKDVVQNTSITNLPEQPDPTRIYFTKIRLDCKGPAMKLRIGSIFEADITFCIPCYEWPTMSDWSSRPRYWPSAHEAQKIMSLGCHLVAKAAPSDTKSTSWRFSFSVAEVELSKLVPDTARKCFLALKIILKEHLQPVLPEINSYHVKTIFLNTLEKVPVGFWVEDNIEECFLTLLAELHDALLSMKCRHHWFSFINLFDIEANELERLAKKVERIIKDPAPFIYDDGCCCLSSCCFPVPHNNFTRRSSEQFLAEYDEVPLSVLPVNGQPVTIRAENPGCHSFQLSLSQSSKLEAQFHSSWCSSSEDGCEATTGPEQLVKVTLPPVESDQQRSSICANEVKETSFLDCQQLVVSLPPITDNKQAMAEAHNPDYLSTQLSLSSFPNTESRLPQETTV